MSKTIGAQLLRVAMLFEHRSECAVQNSRGALRGAAREQGHATGRGVGAQLLVQRLNPQHRRRVQRNHWPLHCTGRWRLRVHNHHHRRRPEASALVFSKQAK